MNRNGKIVTVVLLLIVLAEIGAGIWWWGKSSGAVPPVPGLSVVDDVTAGSLKEMVANCKTAEDWHTLANTYMSAGYFAEADSCYEQALKLKPDWGDALYNQAFCLSRFGQTKSANEKFAKVIEQKHEKIADAYFFTGQNHLRDGDPDSAAIAFGKAAPARPMAKFELSRIHFRKGELDEAKELLVGLLSKHPKASRVKLLLAEVLTAQGDEASATSYRVEGTLVTDRLPTPFVTEKNRLADTIGTYGFEKQVRDALKLLEDNKMEEAQLELQNLQRIQWTPSVHSALLDIQIQTKDFGRAAKSIEEELEISGPTSLWLGRLGNVKMMAGDAEGAVEAWKRGLEVRNDSGVEACIAGLGQFFAKEPDGADTANEYQFLVLLEFARRAIKEGDGMKAISHMKRALEINPDSAEAHFLIGKAYRETADSDNAIKALQRCLAIEPTYGDAIRELKLVK